MLGFTIGAILFVAMLAFLFLPSILEMAVYIDKRISEHKKARGTR